MNKISIRILLVEDNPGDARLFREFLYEEKLIDIKVDHVDRLKVGLERLTQGKPDVILLDLGLPDSQGLETFKQVYAQAPDVPIVVLTGLNDAAQAVEAVKGGAQDYLVKGEVSSGLLMRAIRYAIERKRTEEFLRESEERFSSLYRNVTVGMYRTTREGRILMANPSMVRMLGFDSFDQLAKRNLEQEGHEPDYPRSQFLEAMEEHDEIIGLESAWQQRDGKTLFVRESARTIRDAQGQILYFDGTVEDITARKQAEARIQRQLEHLTSLSTIDRLIASVFDLKLCLSEILTHVTKELGVDAADILILSSKSLILEYSAEHGFRTDAIRKVQVRLGESLAGCVALERRLIQVPNLRDEPRDRFITPFLTGEDFFCYYGVPLIAKGHVKGVLEVYHRSALEPDAEWFNFLNTLAGQAGIAIENATLFEGLQRSNSELYMAYDATIEGWSRALDLRDKETESHTQRVTQMTEKLASAFGLRDEELAQVRWGTLLHDIGKMGLPDSILLKPGPLTEEEWETMKMHPTLANEMLSPIRYLSLALDIPYCHHEKWDGTGYPRGLKGEQIPLAARIFAVVDVWDALTSDRPYRKAWSEEKARRHIKSGSGTHFDPQVVKEFFSEHG